MFVSETRGRKGARRSSKRSKNIPRLGLGSDAHSDACCSTVIAAFTSLRKIPPRRGTWSSGLVGGRRRLANSGDPCGSLKYRADDRSWWFVSIFLAPGASMSGRNSSTRRWKGARGGRVQGRSRGWRRTAKRDLSFYYTVSGRGEADAQLFMLVSRPIGRIGYTLGYLPRIRGARPNETRRLDASYTHRNALVFLLLLLLFFLLLFVGNPLDDLPLCFSVRAKIINGESPDSPRYPRSVSSLTMTKFAPRAPPLRPVPYGTRVAPLCAKFLSHRGRPALRGRGVSIRNCACLWTPSG